jgi:hypothetical protein
MKLTSLTRNLAVALPLLALSLGASGLASAQPAGAPAKKGTRGRKAKSGISPKLLSAIETKTGKAVPADQKTRLDAASATHRAAIKAADEQFRSEIARITGLSEADAKALGRKPKGAKTTAPKQ